MTKFFGKIRCMFFSHNWVALNNTAHNFGWECSHCKEIWWNKK